MPKILLKNNTGKQDITDLTGHISWSGSVGDISRVLEFTILHPKHDVYTPRFYPNLGDVVQLLADEGHELFRGVVFYAEQVSQQGTVKITCYDDSIRLSKSTGTFNFKNSSAESIARRVCEEINLPVGSLASTGINQKLLVQGGGLYQTIVDAYNVAATKNGNRYLPLMMNGKLNVIQVGGTTIDYVLEDSVNIISSSFSESAGAIINKVKIYNDKDQYISEVSNQESINKFGIFQSTYTKEKNKDPKTMAKNSLQNVERSISISAIGNTSCISGYNIKVIDSTTKIAGRFQISSDTHKWENGQYTVDLELIYMG